MTIQGGASASVDFSNDDSLASKVSSSESYTRRIMIKIDTQNYIPSNAVIRSAYLYLTLKASETSETRSLTAYWVNKSFVKNETTWNTFRSGQYWGSRGGDLGTRFATTSIGDAEGTAYRIDLTSLVQKAVNGEFGSRYTRVALVDTGGVSNGSYKEFYSTRAANSSVRPRLVVTYGGTATGTASEPAPSPAPAPTPTPAPSGTTLRVMQWNVHKTKGNDGVCNPDRIATVIAWNKPDVVSLNEVNFYSGECAYTFDMGEKLRSLVQSKLGGTWYKQNVNVNGGSSGYGNVLLSRFPPATSGSRLLSYERGVAQMGIYVNGRMVNIFSTHVEYFNSSWRPIQIREAISWMGTFSEPRIMMGDFNTSPGTADYNIMASPYQDAWVKAQQIGSATAFNGTGNTNTGSRFDYVFFSRVSALTLRSVNVPDNRVSGVKAADHDPVVAVFTVN